MKPFRSHKTKNEGGFTLLELVLVLFLLGGLLSLVIPRMTIGENLSSVTRKWAGTLKSMQEMSMSTQKPVRLYIDMERGTYWPVVVHGTEEKPPLDAVWATPITLPESIHFTDFQLGGSRRDSGRVDLMFYPNGRIDPAVMHLTDTRNDVMGVKVEPVTAMIRISDHRIEPPIRWPIPDRIKTLLQPTSPVPQSPIVGSP